MMSPNFSTGGGDTPKQVQIQTKLYHTPPDILSFKWTKNQNHWPDCQTFGVVFPQDHPSLVKLKARKNNFPRGRKLAKFSTFRI
jgi:hypothetical protein